MRKTSHSTRNEAARTHVCVYIYSSEMVYNPYHRNSVTVVLEVYMALRTMLPGLLKVLRETCKYIARNRDRIERFLENPENVLLLDAVVTACEAMEAVLEELIPHKP